ncbi:MAG: tetratricopeptide repeat protein [Abditibacteriales bacterium]|nr:tetratricopeptide repeat protein [Abditibacteriales bacterium]
MERVPLKYLEALASRPHADAWVHYSLGRALAKQQRHREAVDSFGNALRALQQKENLALRARVDGELALSLVALGHHRLAVPYLKRALELDVANVPAHLALGKVLAHRQHYTVAIQEFRVVTELAPHDPEGWFALGQALNESRQPQEAEAPLRKAVELAPRESRYWLALGDCFAYRARFEEAVECFERAVQVDPDNTTAQGALVRAQSLCARTPEDYRKVRPALLQLAEKEAHNGFFQGQVGILEAQFGEEAEAERRLKLALMLLPDYPEAAYNLAMLYQRQGKRTESQRWLKRFQYLEALHRRISSLRRRLSLRPHDVELNLALGRALEEQGSDAEAAQQYRYLLRRVDPKNAEAAARLRRLEQRGAVPREPGKEALP